MGKTWLEVALNGSWGRVLQPRIPVSIDEIIAEGIACVRTGAAIVHLHAYDAQTGRQNDDPEIYARIIEGIHAQGDAIIYPTVIGGTEAGSELTRMGASRYAAVAALGERGLLEWTVVDPGSTNTSSYHDIARNRAGSVYMNPQSDINTGLELAERHAAHPSFAIYEPGFLRLGAALAKRHVQLKQPIYRFMFSDGFTFGMPPREYALDAYVAMMRDFAPGAPWMVAGLMADMTPLIAKAVALGGHVRTGLEDALLGNERSNQELVEAAANEIARAGGSLASAMDVRQALAR